MKTFYYTLDSNDCGKIDQNANIETILAEDKESAKSQLIEIGGASWDQDYAVEARDGWFGDGWFWASTKSHVGDFSIEPFKEDQISHSPSCNGGYWLTPTEPILVLLAK